MSEKKILILLYERIDSKKSKLIWEVSKQGSDHCLWGGIECTEKSKMVKSISLSKQELTGKIRKELFNLTVKKT